MDQNKRKHKEPTAREQRRLTWWKEKNAGDIHDDDDDADPFVITFRF